MIQELMALTSTAITLVNNAAVTTNTAIKAVDNVVGAAEKSTRVLDHEAQNLLAWHDIRIQSNNKEQAAVLKMLSLD